MIKKLAVIGVIGSNQEEWATYAEPLGRALAKRPVHLLTGGGRGVMTSVSRSFAASSKRKGMTIACVPTVKTADGSFEAKDGYPNPYVEFSVVSPLGTFNPKMPEQVNRNFVNILSSDIVIALPGRTGTRNEISLCAQFGKQVLLHGPERQWQDLPKNFPREENLQKVLTWLDARLSPRA